MEVMVWNRKLSADEMKATVRYLNDKLAGARGVVQNWVAAPKNY